MQIDNNNSKHIIAESNKIFKRISDNIIFGNELYLGITYYLNGELLEVPLEELPEHYIEIDNVVIDNVVIENPSYIEDAVIVE